MGGIVAAADSSVTGEFMARLPALEIISVLGVGYDGIDLQAARERQVLTADQFVRQDEWSTGRYPMTTRVSGGRIGIVGLGRIGKAVALRAQAFGIGNAGPDPW